MDLRHEVLGHRHDHRHAAVVLGGQDDDAALHLVLQRVGHLAEAGLVEPLHAAGDEGHPADVRLGGGSRGRGRAAREAGRRHLHLELAVLARQPLEVGLQPFDGRHCLVGRGLERVEHRGEPQALLAVELQRPVPGQRLDPALPRGDAALVQDHEAADVAGGGDVRAAAQLLAEPGNRDDADAVAVLLAEQRHRAAGDRLLGGAHLGLDRRVAQDLVVDQPLDLGQLVARHRLGVHEVEAQPIGGDERAGLLHVGAEHLPQRGVQQVGGRVVAPRGVAQFLVHRGAHGVVRPERALLDDDLVQAGAIGGHAHQPLHPGPGARGGDDRAGVRHLAARLDVERRPVEREVPGLALPQLVGRLPLPVEQRDHREAVEPRRPVALELVGAAAEPLGRGLEGAVARRGEAEPVAGPRLLLLSLHGALEAGAVEGDLAVLGHVLDEVAGDAEGVVETKRLVAREHPVRRRRAVEALLELRQAEPEHRLEALLLGQDHPLDVLALLAQLGVRLAHLRRQHGHQPVEERLAHPEVLAVRHRAAHDAPQGVAAELVRRHHAVGDEEGRGAGVIGDHPHRDVGRLHRAAVARPGEPPDGVEQRGEQVGVVVRQHPLQHRRDPFEPHAGVDRRRGQRDERPVRLPLELHEHVVPDFDVAVAGAGHAEAHRLGAGEVVPAEVVHLGAAAAGPRFAHRPEVVLAQLADPLGRQVPTPDGVGVVVARHLRHRVPAAEDRGVQAVGRQLPDLGEQRPGEGDRVGLEVVAEGEVSQHLEERVVARRGAHVLEVVVLPADPHALLRGGGAPVLPALAAQEDVLELVHPRVGEEQCGVVGRDEGRAGYDAVALPGEEVEERGADLRGSHNRLF